MGARAAAYRETENGKPRRPRPVGRNSGVATLALGPPAYGA